MKIAVGVRIAESRTDRLVDEEQIGKLVPRAIVHLQRLIVLEAVWPNFHQRAVHRTAPGSTIQPEHGPLFIRNVTVLIMPEEQVTVRVRVDLDVPVRHFGLAAGPSPFSADRILVYHNLPSMHLQSGILGGTR